MSVTMRIARVGQPMDIKKLFPIILVAFSSASHAGEPKVGFAWRGAEQITYLYTTSDVKPGNKISIQYPSGKGVIKCCKVTAIGDGMSEQATVTDELNGAEVYRYKLENQYNKPFVGIAVIGDVLAKETPTGIAIKNRKTRISTCWSQEGVHLFSETNGKVEAHLYLPLGYDVKPTCDPHSFRIH